MPDRIGKARSQMTRYRRLGRGGECCARACNEFRAAQRQRIAATGSSQMCGGAETSKLPNSAGDRGFESISLQRRVSLSASAFEGRGPRLSARVSAAGWATGSAETRTVFQFAPIGGIISVGPYSSTALPLNGADEGRPLIRTKSGLRRTERAVDL